MRYNGKITDWNDDRGFGFVTTAGTGVRHFMHIRSFHGRGRRPAVGDAVTFELQPQDGGRSDAAVKVLPMGERFAAPTTGPSRSFAIDWLIALLQALALGIALLTARLPGWVAALVLAGSFMAFVIYNIDKRRAEQGLSHARISEVGLLQISLIGWPGALAAQQLFRHKSSKSGFYVPFRLVGLGQAFVLAWFALGRSIPI
jgi:uncharacterized membrane protein YsdA (DUF1294 family)/cold shock CspA family protein